MATITQIDAGGVPWTAVRGERQAAFESLGEHARADIADVLEALPQLAELRERRAAEPALRDHIAAVAAASRRDCPQTWSELEALAAGAGAAVEDLLLLNLRGDLGSPSAGSVAGAGCTTVAWSDGQTALLGHNEDGDAELSGRCRLLTLQIEELPAVTMWWYPGFIPANTFAINSSGVACAIDHINVVLPAVAPGRHFLARELHRCTDLDDAVSLLGRRPSAGGFSYTLGQAGRADVHAVERAAGAFAATSRPAADGSRLLAHANHLVLLGRDLDAPKQESLARAEIAAAALTPEAPARDRLLSVLRTDRPDGVNRNATDGDTLVTLATFVVDLVRATVTVIGRGAKPFELPVLDFASARFDGVVGGAVTAAVTGTEP